VIFIDSNIPMYLVGEEHPHKVDARRLLERLIAKDERLVTDAEVLLEILHRYTAIDRKDAIQPAFDAIVGIVDEVLPIEAAEKNEKLAHIELLNDDRPYPGVEQAARDSFRRWKYEPGKMAGQPVDAGVTISVIFRGMSAATMTRPADNWAFREINTKGLPTSILDKAIFNGRRGGRYTPANGEFPGGDVKHGTGCDFKAGPRCAYLIPGGPFYNVDMPLADSGLNPGTGK
jgi:hypothetical protein